MGYIAYNSYQNTVTVSREDAFKTKIKELEEANAVLMQENNELTEKVTILSKTVNEKVDAEKVQEEKNLPKGFPLSGKAAMEETQETIEGEDGDEVRPILLFDADDEVSVVATGGNAPVIVRYCRNKIVYDKFLLMEGLWTIYQKNK